MPVGQVRSVRELKQELEGPCGLPRFRQRILRSGVSLDDEAPLDSPADLQLVLLQFASASHAEKAALSEAIYQGDILEVERILNQPQDPQSCLKHFS